MSEYQRKILLVDEISALIEYFDTCFILSSKKIELERRTRLRSLLSFLKKKESTNIFLDINDPIKLLLIHEIGLLITVDYDLFSLLTAGDIAEQIRTSFLWTSLVK
jgi:hypothetical protein